MSETPDKTTADVTREAPPETVVKDASEVMQDCAKLLELQAALFQEDADEGLHRLVRAAVFAISALILCLAGLPIVLAAGALWLYHLGLSLAASFSIAAVCVMLGVAGLGLAARSNFQRPEARFSRSRRELAANWQWLKRVLANSRRSSAHAS